MKNIRNNFLFPITCFIFFSNSIFGMDSAANTNQEPIILLSFLKVPPKNSGEQALYETKELPKKYLEACLTYFQVLSEKNHALLSTLFSGAQKILYFSKEELIFQENPDVEKIEKITHLLIKNDTSIIFQNIDEDSEEFKLKYQKTLEGVAATLIFYCHGLLSLKMYDPQESTP
jgi:hypothetical protein